jgi:hypothetical protein
VIDLDEAATDLAGSAGTIDFPDEPPRETEAISADGSFTDFGVALTTDAPEPSDTRAPDAAQVTADDHHAAEASSDDMAAKTAETAPAAPSLPVVTELTSALDELSLRPADGLI